MPGVAAAKENRAQVQPKPLPNIIRGEVASIAGDSTSFNVKPGNGEEITIKVDGNTRYFIITGLSVGPVQGKVREKVQKGKGPKNGPNVERGLGKRNGIATDEDEEDIEHSSTGTARIIGWLEKLLAKLGRPGQKATFADIAVGDNVVVRVMPNENLAKQVFIIRAGKIGRVNGTITAMSGQSITITAKDGTKVTINWDGDTRFELRGLIQVQVNQRASAVYNPADMKAKLVVVSPPAPASATTTTVTT